MEIVLRRDEPIRMPNFGFVRNGEGVLRHYEHEGWFFQNMQNSNFYDIKLLFLKLIPISLRRK